MGYFFPNKWKLAIFSFLKLENIIEMFQNVIQVFKLKNSIWLCWNIMILTRIREFSRQQWGIFSPKLKSLNFCFIFQIGKHYTNVPNVIQVFELKNSMWFSWNIMILTQIGGFFPTSMGFFSPKKWKFVIVFIFQIEKHYTNVPNVIQVFKLKIADMNRLKANYNNTNWGNFFHILGGIF